MLETVLEFIFVKVMQWLGNIGIVAFIIFWLVIWFVPIK